MAGRLVALPTQQVAGGDAPSPRIPVPATRRSPCALRPPPAGRRPAWPGPARRSARRGRQARRPKPRRGKGGRGPLLTAGSTEEETQRRPRQRRPTPAPAGSSELPGPKYRRQRRRLGLYGQSSGLAPTSATAAAPSGSVCHETPDARVGGRSPTSTLRHVPVASVPSLASGGVNMAVSRWGLPSLKAVQRLERTILGQEQIMQWSPHPHPHPVPINRAKGGRVTWPFRVSTSGTRQSVSHVSGRV